MTLPTMYGYDSSVLPDRPSKLRIVQPPGELIAHEMTTRLMRQHRLPLLQDVAVNLRAQEVRI
jgi:hypothetical protein